MLTCIRVRQLAIIDSLELELGPGLNVLTGETGAGKSILVAAIQLIRGDRARADLVRTGAERAEVEALVDLSSSPEGRARVRALTGEADDELVIRRVVQATGRSRAYVNGRLVTAMQLAALTEELVDISSQHEHHSLVDGSTHLDLLDAYAELASLRSEVEGAWGLSREAATALENLATALRERADREAVLRFQLDELATGDPKAGEDDELAAEHDRLAGAEELASATREAEHRLQAGDGAICSELSQLARRMEGLTEIDPQLRPILAQLEGARAELEDAATELGRYTRGIQHDPGRLQEIEDRMGLLRRLCRRYGGTLDHVVAHRQRAEDELARFDDLEQQLEDAEAARDVAFESLTIACRSLSQARGAASANLGTAITRELSALGMGHAQVLVEVARLDRHGGGGLEVDGARVTASGMDRVEFLIAPNRGEQPRPLRRIASGGELSRALLAVKCVLAEQGPQGLYVFDEVDTGVGGGVAEVLGRKLQHLSKHHQVLCITHQPQLAVYGDRHVHVRKGIEGERTLSRLVELEGEERVEEIARMLGGVEIGDATRAAARELLEDAARHRLEHC